MRRLRQAALLAVSSITVAACLPSRDNGADPSIRPTAVLSVASGGFIPYGASGGDGDGDGCIDVPDTFSPVITRAKCVHLSAVGSSDPQGNGTLAEYRFALVTTSASENATLLPEHVIVSTEGTVGTALSVVFRAPNLRQQVPGEYQARLEVIDRDGHSHVTLTSLSVENSRPIAVPPSPRFVTSWGAAWTTAAVPDLSGMRPLTIHFSADGSFDPDGDPLNYCWRDRTNQVDLGCATDPEIAVAPAPTSSSGKLVLELRVDDVFSVSQPVLATAVLDAEPGWAFENDTASVKVLDERRNFFLLDTMNQQPSDIVRFREALAIDVASNLDDSILYFLSGNEVTIARRRVAEMCPNQTECGSAPLTSRTFPATVQRVAQVVIPRGKPYVWSISTNTNGLTRIDALNPATLATLATTTTQGALLNDNDYFAKVDRNGRLWTGSPFSDGGATCFEFVASPSPVVNTCGTVPVDPGYILTGLALRDLGGSEEVWAMQSRNFLTGALGAPSAKVLTAGGAVENVEVNSSELAFEADLAFSLEFVDSNLSWLNLFGEGIASVELCYEDPSAAPPGDGPVDADTQLCVRNVAPFEASFETLSDPATGTFLALGLEGYSLNRMTLGGQPGHITSPERIESLLHVDAASGVWSVTDNDQSTHVLARGKGSGKDGLILTVPVGTTLVEPILDAASGDVWVSALFPPGAARFSPDGSRTDFVSAIVAIAADGTPVGGADAVPNLIVLPGGTLPDPQRGHVWVIGNIDPTSGGGSQLSVFEPNARRSPAAPAVALGVRGLEVPLVTSAMLGSNGEVIVNAAVHVQSGDLIVMTASSEGLGSSCGAVLPPSKNYFLRRIPAVNGGAALRDVPVCVAPNYTQMNGDTPVRFARDLSSGDVCVGFRANSSTVVLRRFKDGETLESEGVQTAPTGETVAEIAADPQNCWMAGRRSSGANAAWALGPGNLMFTLTARDALGSLIDIPSSSTIHPVVGFDEVRNQSGATRVWLGGGGGSAITLYTFPNGPSMSGKVDPRALPLSSDFEMTFVKH